MYPYADALVAFIKNEDGPTAVEYAVMLAPIEKPLTMIGLGMSVGTPPEGITGEVLPVENPNLLSALGREKVAGKIVRRSGNRKRGRRLRYLGRACGNRAIVTRVFNPCGRRKPKEIWVW